MLLLVRRIGAVLLVVCAALVWFLMTPDSPSQSFTNPSDHSSAISEALTNDETNNASAEGAPQQTVVNGWTARDLLTIIAKQEDELSAQNFDIASKLAAPEPRDLRPTALLALVVAGLSLAIGTTATIRPATVQEVV